MYRVSVFGGAHPYQGGALPTELRKHRNADDTIAPYAPKIVAYKKEECKLLPLLYVPVIRTTRLSAVQVYIQLKLIVIVALLKV